MKNLFTKKKNGKPLNKNKNVNLTDTIGDLDKEMFALYVDVMPMKWNVHFVPQAIFCDLYRKVNQFEFVGNMGANFMNDLNRMATRFGGKLPDVLNQTFKYQLFVNGAEHVNTGSSKKHATHAPAKVAKFYTARTIRRALEYLSIDYVTLGLEVPEWARTMLREDTQ